MRALPARWLVAAVIAVALVQTAALGKMVTDRAALLRDGREVVLETGAIDPRDLFRGHYTILNLEITRVSRSTVTVDPALEVNAPVYVSLTESDDGYWRAKGLNQTGFIGDDLVPILRQE